MKQQSSDKQQYILNIAEAEFVRHGFKNTTIRKITVAAKMNTAMLHYYFKSKEQLFEVVLNRKLDTLTPTNLRNIPEDYNSFKELKKVVNQHIDNAIENKAFYRLLYAEMLIGDSHIISRKIREFFCSNKQKLRQILEHGIQKKIFKPMDIDLVLVSIFGTLIHSLTKLENDEDEVTKARIQAYFESYFNSIL